MIAVLPRILLISTLVFCAGSQAADLEITIAGGAAEEQLADELAAKVLIRRDTYGVPHILGETEEAAIFGYGYAAAEDRILEIARLMHKAAGTEARWFGERHYETDLAMRQFRNVAVARETYAGTAPWFRRIVDAYAIGYNRYLRQHRDDLPAWVVPISGVQVLAHIRRVTAIEFCMDLRQISRIGREARAEAGEEEMIGSNMWAVNSDRSTSGNALLLGNPHLAWSGSHVWHEAHITVPGELNFMGAALIGIPAPALGWNDNLGWSHTVNPHDCDDVYALERDPENFDAYLYEGRSVALNEEKVAIEVKTDDGVEEREETIYRTHYGPVVKSTDDTLYAYKSASMGEGRMAEQWYLMAKARTLEEFRNVLDMQALPMFNIAYADVKGNCFFLFNGRFPDRPQGRDWGGVVEGGTRETEWLGILPQARLPQLLNPETGYVQNSNSAPWYTNIHSIIDRTKFPADLCDNSNSLRTQHGISLLEQNESVAFDEILRDKYSMRLLAAERVKPDLLKILAPLREDDAALDAIARVLEEWDNSVSRDARGAILFSRFWQRYARGGEPVYEVAWDENDPTATPHGVGDAKAAVAAVRAAAEQTKEEAGALDAKWGDLYRLRHGDVDVPIGGAGGEYGAFRIVGYGKAEDGKYVAGGGDSYVFAVEFSQPLKTRSILAYSQSGDPESPHHDDQCELFANNEWKPTYFNENDLAKNITRTYRP